MTNTNNMPSSDETPITEKTWPQLWQLEGKHPDFSGITPPKYWIGDRVKNSSQRKYGYHLRFDLALSHTS